LFDSTIPYDLHFYEALDRFMQREPWIDRDRVMIDQLKTIGTPARKESNWVATISGGRFEVLFRFYGPENPLFDKTWKLGDIEEVK
jgi:hypothetical protein